MLFLDLTALFADSLEEEVTFLSLKSRIVELLLQALLTESDAPNTQMLLGESVDSCAQHTDVASKYMPLELHFISIKFLKIIDLNNVNLFCHMQM